MTEKQTETTMAQPHENPEGKIRTNDGIVHLNSIIGEDDILMLYRSADSITADLTSRRYLSNRNRKLAQDAFQKGRESMMQEQSGRLFSGGYELGYREGSGGIPFRNPFAESPEESETHCDFRCELCSYSCKTCGHCTFYDMPRERPAEQEEEERKS